MVRTEFAKSCRKSGIKMKDFDRAMTIFKRRHGTVGLETIQVKDIESILAEVSKVSVEVDQRLPHIGSEYRECFQHCAKNSHCVAFKRPTLVRSVAFDVVKSGVSVKDATGQNWDRDTASKKVKSYLLQANNYRHLREKGQETLVDYYAEWY